MNGRHCDGSEVDLKATADASNYWRASLVELIGLRRMNPSLPEVSDVHPRPSWKDLESRFS